ncbi:tRNA endonuclease ANKZF1 [Gastrophryne carolinensis]
MTSPASQTFSLFDLSLESPLLSGLSLKNNTKDDFTEKKEKLPEGNDGGNGLSVLEISDRMSCTACQCTFDGREEQKEHYTLDWHRFNLKRKLKGATTLSEEDFQDKTQAGDLSSISGSDSESSEEEDSGNPDLFLESSPNKGHPSRAQRSLFRNGDGKLLSVFRCVLGLAKETEMSPEQLLNCVSGLQEKPVVLVLMAGGGHFAGAVFKGKEVLKHKTFHRYTVRAKRGTSQALHDAQKCIARSAGAALRRYNQAALRTDINQLLQSWTGHITEARRIFLRAPHSDKTLFLGRNSPIPKKDPRVFSIPFITRRATFREVQRVHAQLFTLLVFVDVPSDDDVPTPEEYVEEEVTLSTLDLRDYEVQPKRKRKKKRKKDEAGSLAAQEINGRDNASQTRADDSTCDPDDDVRSRELSISALEGDEQSRVQNALFTCCKTGDSETARQILQELLPDPAPSPTAPAASQVVRELVNRCLPVEKRTLLHVAAAAGHGEVACVLMDAGWDPALRDAAAQTPYSLSANKRTRNSFRKYREDNPDKYNYSKSQIPGPVSEEIEVRKAEKKRAQKAQRKQKEKEEKEERLRKEEEEAEKKKFAALSDREKRALAAERRLATQLGHAKENAGSDVRRCWLCGESLLGKVPFEYLNLAFCTTRCLQEHRRSQPQK